MFKSIYNTVAGWFSSKPAKKVEPKKEPEVKVTIKSVEKAKPEPKKPAATPAMTAKKQQPKVAKPAALPKKTVMAPRTGGRPKKSK